MCYTTCLIMSNWKVNRYSYKFWKALVQKNQQFSGNNFTGRKCFKTKHCAATPTQKEQIWRNKWFKLTQSWSLLAMQKLCEMTTLRVSANSFGYISCLMGDLLELTLKSVRNFLVTTFIHKGYSSEDPSITCFIHFVDKNYSVISRINFECN